MKQNVGIYVFDRTTVYQASDGFTALYRDICRSHEATLWAQSHPYIDVPAKMAGAPMRIYYAGNDEEMTYLRDYCREAYRVHVQKHYDQSITYQLPGYVGLRKDDDGQWSVVEPETVEDVLLYLFSVVRAFVPDYRPPHLLGSPVENAKAIAPAATVPACEETV